MKRFIISLISLSMCVILLAGCKKKKEPQESGECIYTPTFSEYDEYAAYIEEKRKEGYVPDNFFDFNKISSIGAFDCFVESSSGILSTYTYDVNDENKVTFDFTFAMIPQSYILSDKNYTKRMKPNNTADMRVFRKKISGSYIHERVIGYYYFKGNLETVFFKVNGSYVYVSVSKWLGYSKYPLESDNFESKLLNLDTAVQAVTEVFGTPQPIEDFFNQG